MPGCQLSRRLLRALWRTGRERHERTADPTFVLFPPRSPAASFFFELRGKLSNFPSLAREQGCVKLNLKVSDSDTEPGGRLCPVTLKQP